MLGSRSGSSEDRLIGGMKLRAKHCQTHPAHPDLRSARSMTLDISCKGQAVAVLIAQVALPLAVRSLRVRGRRVG